MDPETRFKRASRFVRRDAAERYLFITLLSFSASVSLTRLYLSLTGYPQIGGGELHIAHVLWGGLLLFAAALVPLILANRWVYPTSAVLAGLGVGLFIDEVGKFITQKNDYFYPAAAPIIYTFFLLTILLYLHVRRMPDSSPNAELHRALGDIRQLLEQPLQPERYARLESALDSIARNSAAESKADLARSLLSFVRAQGNPVAAAPAGRSRRIRERVLRPMEAFGSGSQLRTLLCTQCHASGAYHTRMPSLHAISNGCTTGAGCHTSGDLSVIHTKQLVQHCEACHAEGKTPSNSRGSRTGSSARCRSSMTGRCEWRCAIRWPQ